MNPNGLSGLKCSIDEHVKLKHETNQGQPDTIFVSGQKIPRLHLGLNRETDGGKLLASRSTRRQIITNNISCNTQNTMNRMLNEMARTLGVCYLTNDIGWLLDKERYKKTEKSTQRFLETDKYQHLNHHISNFINKDFDVAEAKKTTTQRRPIINREVRRTTDDPKLLIRESFGRFNGNYDWAKKDEQFKLNQQGNMVIDVVRHISPKLYKKLKTPGTINPKDKYFSVFSHPKFIKRAIQWFKKKDIESIDMINLLKFLEYIFQNGSSVIDYGELILLARSRIFENEIRYKNTTCQFYNLLKQLLKESSHYAYKLIVFIDHDLLLKSIKNIIKNIEYDILKPSYELEVIVDLLHTIIDHSKLLLYAGEFKIIQMLLTKLAQSFLCPKKESNNTNNYIIMAWISYLVTSEEINDITFFKKLCKIIKMLLFFSSDKKLKASYFRTIYLLFLRLYSSLHKYYKTNHLIVISKLLSLLRSISLDKKNSEIASIIRQYNIIQFIGKEFDLEYQVYNDEPKGNHNLHSLTDVQDLQNSVSNLGTIPKLDLNACEVIDLRRNKEKTYMNSKNDMSIPKLDLNSLPISKCRVDCEKNNQNNMCNERYNIATQWRKIYAHANIHKECIKFILTILLTENCNSLEEEFTGQYPIQSGKLHYLFYLQCHLSQPDNQEFLHVMLQKLHTKLENKKELSTSSINEFEKDFLSFAERHYNIKDFNKNEFSSNLLKSIKLANSGIYRLLKCLGHSEQKITLGQKIGEGAYSVVYSLRNDKTKAVKIIQPDTSIFDRNALFYLFNEVSAIEYLNNQNNMHLKMIDYGLNLDLGYYLIFPFLNKKLCTNNNAIRTLNIFEDICREVADLHDKKVVHYDIKADNVMLCKDKAILVDYGEALQNEPSLRLRGTEIIRAPEMLLSGLECYEFDQIQGPSKYKETMALYKRHTRYNVSSACDIWGLGCLLYELYTGEFLFHSKDWSNYFYMVTNDSYTIINDHIENKLDNNFFLIGLMKYIMVRNAQQRPSCKSVLKKVKAIRRLISGDCVITSRMNSLRKIDTK